MIGSTTFLVALFSVFCMIEPLSAQQNFTPLKQGDYEVVEENTSFNPGAKIGGDYRASYNSRREGIVFGSDYYGGIQQDISLKIESKINTNVSLHATLGNKSSSVSEQEVAYDTENPAERGDSSGDEGLSIVFKEAFLEYNHNPNASLKIGRQSIAIGDKMGLIYKGTATAITQGCRIGSWCYYVGGARLGEEGDSALFWAQLDYPVFQSGVLVADPWGKKPTRQQKSLNVELFRTIYRGKDIPLADYGGWTGENSDFHDTTDDTSQGARVYYDNDGVEYMGFNVAWNFYGFHLDFTWSSLTGSRKYHTGNQDEGGVTEFAEKNTSGNAYYANAEYQYLEDWKAGMTLFNASGNKVEKDGEKIWEDNSKAYHEVIKGNYDEALIYFNGKNGIGDGHSVSNLIYYALKSSYRSVQKDLGVDLSFYYFRRNSPVFINEIGEEAKKDDAIGYELDFNLKWRLEERLSLQFYAAVFQPGAAYSPNDNIRPVKDPEDFSLLGVTGTYCF
ncbi:MAG: hypothetical protein GY866_21830 [Proteobacteria bacterium]|nr:hypothetical protein [Pseudomonadota bacterium]